MRKTSAYAMKQRRLGATYNGAAWANTIQRCRPYTDEEVVPGWGVGKTQVAADEAAILIRTAFMHIRDGQADHADSLERDRLAHAIGVAKLRALEIAGQDPFTNHMLPIIHEAEEAMRRMDSRWMKLKRWGFDGPAIEAMEAAVELYETILQSSSPAEMEAVSKTRMRILKEQGMLV